MVPPAGWPYEPPARARSGAEWVTFAVSTAVLVVVAGLILTNVGGGGPPRPTVTLREAEVVAVDGGFQVPVEVHNEGGRAAAGVQVLAELVGPDGTEESDQTIDFLGVDERIRLVFVFGADPSAGELSVVVGGFAVP